MISVFTPTFNRADTIHRVYDSLIQQTYGDFEWVVIDDGSEDAIEDAIEGYKKLAKLSIIFHKFSENRGKHNATNKALELATGEFFVVADSDDAFTSDALQFFIDGWESITDKENFCGIRACCEDQHGERVSDTLPKEPLDCSMAEAFYIHKFRKESWTMVLTEWHRKFLFPESHKGYYPEGIIWKAMSREKKLRFFNKVTRIYFVNDSDNSIMHEKKHPKLKIARNLVGGRNVLNNDIPYFFYDVKRFLKTSLIYGTYALFNNAPWAAAKELDNFKAKFLYWCMMPISLVAYLFKSMRS